MDFEQTTINITEKRVKRERDFVIEIINSYFQLISCIPLVLVGGKKKAHFVAPKSEGKRE